MSKLLGILVSTIICISAADALGAVNNSTVEATLSEIELSHLIFMREEEKLARDVYITLAATWGARVFSNISSSEQNHMDALLTMLDTYSVDDPVIDNSTGAYSDVTLAGLYLDLVSLGESSLLNALFVGALIEEIDIGDLNLAISETDQADLDAVYESLLAGSKNRLRAFVGQIERLGVTYEAQVLDQAEVDSILGKSDDGAFTLNAGLNDAWYYPETDGQGLFIMVFPDLGKVTLAWFTYDTELPPVDAIANLGDAGHRWLTALGPIDGNRSIMNITFTSGGLFDTPTDIQRTDPEGSDGTITLIFNSCNSATLEYDITSINQHGIVPLQRVADDNIVICEALQAD